MAERTVKEIISEAMEAEKSNNYEGAITLYQDALNTDELNEYAYNRILLLFRKQRDYKKELAIIKKGIEVFEKFYESKVPNKSKIITEISNKLNKSFGFIDQKGNSLYNPEPISKWKKRKLVVEKRLSKKN